MGALICCCHSVAQCGGVGCTVCSVVVCGALCVVWGKGRHGEIIPTCTHNFQTINLAETIIDIFNINYTLEYINCRVILSNTTKCFPIPFHLVTTQI